MKRNWKRKPTRKEQKEKLTRNKLETNLKRSGKELEMIWEKSQRKWNWKGNENEMESESKVNRKELDKNCEGNGKNSTNELES